MSIATLCVNCLDTLGYDSCCEDGCTQNVDHTGTCHPGGATQCDDCGAGGFLKEVTIVEGDDPRSDGCDCADCYRAVNGTDPYDHSLAKEDARNAAAAMDQVCDACPHPDRVHDERIRPVSTTSCSTCFECAKADDDPEEECLHCGYPILAGSGAVVRCKMCGVFCCEDHHQRHPAYARHDIASTGLSSVLARAGDDGTALDAIAHILRDPDWAPAMLEDIAEIVGDTGRALDNPSGAPTWMRH